MADEDAFFDEADLEDGLAMEAERQRMDASESEPGSPVAPRQPHASDEEEEEGGEQDEFLGAGGGAASSETASEAGGAPAPVAGGKNHVHGCKRQRLSVDDDAAAHVRAPIHAVRRLPCLLSWILSTDRVWDSSHTGFDLIMGCRMVEGRAYQVALANFVRGDRADPEDDGLGGWLLTNVHAMLARAQARPLQRNHDAFLEAEGAEVARALQSVTAALDPDRERAPAQLHPTRLKLHLPLVRLTETLHISAVSSAPIGKQGCRVKGQTLCLNDGRVYLPNAEADVRDGATMTVTLEGAHDRRVVLEFTTRTATMRDGGGEPRQLTLLPTDKLEELLVPRQWSLADVERARRRFAHPSLATDAAIDPERANLLALAMSPPTDLRKWVQHLRLTSAGMFVSSEVCATGGKDLYELWYCGESDGLWRRGHGMKEFKELVNRVMNDVAELADDMDRAVELFWDGLDKDLWRQCELANLVTDELVRAHLSESQAAEIEQLSFEKLVGLLRAQRDGDPQEQAALKRRMRILFSRFHPEDGSYNPPMEALRAEFVEQVVFNASHAQRRRTKEGEKKSSSAKGRKNTIILDESRIVCFSNGFGYDVDLTKFRKIRPGDFVSMHCGYAMPQVDLKARKLLLALLSEIHPDRQVLDWKLSLKARALKMNQSDPIVLSSQGVAGGGKSVEASLTGEAFGEYAYTVDRKFMVDSNKTDANGPNPVLMSLRNRLWVMADEVNRITGVHVKALLGGGKTSSRGLYGQQEIFALRFNNMELLSNISTDDSTKWDGNDEGIGRRMRACQYTQRFTYVSNAHEARRIVADRNQGRNGLTQDELDRGVVPNDAEGPAMEVDGTEVAEQEAAADVEQEAREPEAEPQGAEQEADDPGERSALEQDDPDFEYWSSFPHVGLRTQTVRSPDLPTHCCVQALQVMFPEKHDKLMSLAPQLMVLLCELHTNATRPGGTWPADPPIVTTWTAEAMVQASRDDDTFEKYMRRNYARCPCVVDPRHANRPSSDKLRNRFTGNKCTHAVQMGTLQTEMRNVKVGGTGQTLFEKEGGGGKPSEATERIDAKVRSLQCFCADFMHDRMKQRDPKVNIPNCLHLALTITARSKLVGRRAIYGIVPIDMQFAADGREVMQPAPAPAPTTEETEDDAIANAALDAHEQQQHQPAAAQTAAA